MKLPHKKFVFEISIDAVPHTPETAKEIFGGDFFNPDFGVQTHASELVYEVLKDAHCGCLMAEMKHLSKCKCEVKDMTDSDKSYYSYLQAKTRHAEAVKESLKFVRMEGQVEQA